MAYLQSSPFNPAGFPMMNINCRQAAQNTDIQMVGTVANVGLWDGHAISPAALDGAPANRWAQQQNGPQISDLHRATAFTNGRKRSRENIECEEMKKAKTGCDNAVGYEQMFMNQMQQAGPYGQPNVFQQRGFHSHNPTSCFPSSFMEHQSLMYAERHYDGSVLAALVAEAHGC